MLPYRGWASTSLTCFNSHLPVGAVAMHRSGRRLGFCILLAALVHAALLLLLTSAPHPRVAPPSAPPTRIALLLLPAPAAPLAAVPVPPVKKMAHRWSAAPALERAPAPLAETVPVAAAPVLVDELAPAPPPPPPSPPPTGIDDMMRRARGDIAAIARDLNKERAGRERAFSSAM
jgi:hypothetical protein